MRDYDTTHHRPLHRQIRPRHRARTPLPLHPCPSHPKYLHPQPKSIGRLRTTDRRVGCQGWSLKSQEPYPDALGSVHLHTFPRGGGHRCAPQPLL